ncbi:hypothetical protein [Desulfurivibrio dismutans]|uniref:hypothetical protein n=1 Tax=Desulfurivibrio dismutans TaxID=1398908 RepID=UPI0023DB7A8D|nr:hypothetical protein [Desulfurivibrio alkaliphilus]MDF1614454.1 hypothetical protein [Desulfurivibrio alkaliphilus]
MLQWEIDGRKHWLCRECTRMNTRVFLYSRARLLAVVAEDAKQLCASCGQEAEPLVSGVVPMRNVAAAFFFSWSRWLKLPHPKTVWLQCRRLAGAVMVLLPSRVVIDGRRRALRRAK